MILDRYKGNKQSHVFYFIMMFLVLIHISSLLFSFDDYLIEGIVVSLLTTVLTYYFYRIWSHYLYCHDQLILYTSSHLMYLRDHGVVHTSFVETSEVLSLPLSQVVSEVIINLNDGKDLKGSLRIIEEKVDLPLIRYLHQVMEQIHVYGLSQTEEILFKVTNELEEWSQVFLNHSIQKKQLRGQYYFLIFASFYSFYLLQSFLVSSSVESLGLINFSFFLSLNVCLGLAEYFFSRQVYKIKL